MNNTMLYKTTCPESSQRAIIHIKRTKTRNIGVQPFPGVAPFPQRHLF